MLLHHYYLQDVRVTRLAEALAAIGFDVHVICNRKPVQPDGTREPGEETVRSVHIHRVPLSHKRGGKLRYIFEFTSITLLGIWKLAKLHLKKKFDLVHIHNMPDILVIAGLIPKWLGSTLILDVHDPMSELFQVIYNVRNSHFLIKAIKFQEGLSYRLPDYLMTVSQPMAKNVAKKSGRPVDSIKVIHNFTDLNKFPIHGNTHKWPRNEGHFVILYAGTITKHYGLDIVVKAIATITKDIPTIRLQLLGDGNRIHYLLSLANELGIGDRVKHIERVPIESVKNIMAKADVGISPHNGGTFGNLYFSNKIVDLMTQGVPVLSSRTYTINRYIPEDSIFYFDPGNVEDLAKQITYIYKNPTFVQKKINNAKKLVVKYNWQVEKERFINFYKETLQ